MTFHSFFHVFHSFFACSIHFRIRIAAFSRPMRSEPERFIAPEHAAVAAVEQPCAQKRTVFREPLAGDGAVRQLCPRGSRLRQSQTEDHTRRAARTGKRRRPPAGSVRAAQPSHRATRRRPAPPSWCRRRPGPPTIFLRTAPPAANALCLYPAPARAERRAPPFQGPPRVRQPRRPPGQTSRPAAQARGKRSRTAAGQSRPFPHPGYRAAGAAPARPPAICTAGMP